MTHKKEKTIIISSLVVTSFLIVLFVPKDKVREAQLIFFFKQVLTWLFGLIVVEMGLIKYPYRLFFKRASKSSFSFEYFIYPALSVLFNLHYPEKSKLLIKILFNALYPSIITLLEMVALKYINVNLNMYIIDRLNMYKITRALSQDDSLFDKILQQY
ncbi:CBO0543 family protein [Cytobacillus massiliigabonensis]|uniref:CBO0543 family protein n=1 Tax=Cytobacillus massiliigabonensis TaxID=1871011 RepID=UPI000C8667E9|nr:CBO0543 family protein [Cytobacillus massiliigabonensis]